MADTLTKAKRSWVMSRIKGRNTGPEKAVRRILRARGYKITINLKRLPGKPDIFLPRHDLAIFVHGCFWHRHSCKKASVPKTNKLFWRKKLERNVERDRHNRRDLAKMGYRSLVIWECQVSRTSYIIKKVLKTLSRKHPQSQT